MYIRRTGTTCLGGGSNFNLFEWYAISYTLKQKVLCYYVCTCSCSCIHVLVFVITYRMCFELTLHVWCNRLCHWSTAITLFIELCLLHTLTSHPLSWVVLFPPIIAAHDTTMFKYSLSTPVAYNMSGSCLCSCDRILFSTIWIGYS